MYLPSGWRELKTKENFKLLTGRGQLREVVTYKRWFDLETLGVLENWLLRKGDRLLEAVATAVSTVVFLLRLLFFFPLILFLLALNYFAFWETLEISIKNVLSYHVW